jgi:hypothetical protein
LNFYINERVILQGRKLKCLLTDPTARGAIPTRSQILNAQGRVSLPAEEFHPPAGLRPKGENSPPLTAYWAAEVSTAKLSTGRFTVQTAATQFAGSEDFVVVDRGHYDQLIKAAGSEKLRSRTPFATEAEVASSWVQTWRDLPTYFSLPRRRFLRPEAILFQIKNLPLSSPELAALSREAFDWVNFHIGRFLYDQVFFGGTIDVARSERRDLVEVRLYVDANAPLDREVPYELNAILASLVPDGYKIGVKWVVQTDTGTLDVSWG